MKLILALIVAVGLTACGKPKEMYNGKFVSIQSCMSAIQTHTKSGLRVVRDNPDVVSGYVGKSDRFFACEVKATGTQGVFVHGYWDEE
jgi:hypothetical protein